LKPLSLLIVECDAARLKREGLSFAGEIQKFVELLPKTLSVQLAEINSQADLLEAFSVYAEKYSSIKRVVIIAHSNRNLIRVAPNFELEWRVFARWFLPFKSQKMALVACEAGQFSPTRALFDELPKLKKIYASPFKTTKRQFQIIHLLMSYMLLNSKVDKDVIWAGQVVNFMKTGAIILECTRRNPEGNQALQFLGALSH
jgi:hypothetical protein